MLISEGMKNPLKKLNLGKKTIQCPSCRTKMLVPARPGKTLRVKCTKCRAQFDIKFTSPLAEMFQWNKAIGFKRNVKAMKTRFKALPTAAKVSVSIFSFAILFLIVSIIKRIIS